MNRLGGYWEDLRSSMWLIPTLIVVVAIVLAAALVEVGSLGNRWSGLFGADAEGSRGLLSTIAGSMITVAGVTFSITIVAFTLASSQYTSRILRNFMRDRANQTVLGIFLGVFAYCLIVLRTIRSGDEGAFVPGMAVFVAVLLAFVGIGFLVFFIHHIASSLQATSIIDSVTKETLEALDRVFPAEAGKFAAMHPEEADGRDGVAALPWIAVPASRTGYIQGVDTDALFAFAKEQDLAVRMEKGIGDFIIKGCPLISVSGKPTDDEMNQTLNAAYSVGQHRTVQQDVGYGVRQIVDVALKALSPSTNDTTTAINCIDYLASILAQLATRQSESVFRFEGQQLRVINRGPTFEGLLGEAFDQIRQNAGGKVAVLARLHEVLRIIAGRTTDEERCRALRQQALLITETAERTVPSAHDRGTVQAAHAGLDDPGVVQRHSN